MIVKLAPNVANQIAAGEVIERPSSVVKELIENSIDAGATNIDVEIVNAGRELIRVRDNGEGIEESDFPLVFQRSATSKIKTIDDIYRLMSLGFRGEALASIASVARCDLSSARRGAALGKKISIAGGEFSDIEDINFKQGTEIRVKDLFYNTPVRYKFLKSDAVEKSRLIKIVSMLALSHPEIGFRLMADGDEVFHLREKGNLKDRIQAIYGRDFAKALIPLSASANDITISGFIAGPEYSLGNRSQQFFIINGRVAEADVLKRALNEAYDGLLMKHRHQAYVVVMNLPPQMVDVNVHPQKLEVKFDREDILYSLLYNAARNALISDRTEAEGAWESGDPAEDKREGETPDFQVKELLLGSENHEEIEVETEEDPRRHGTGETFGTKKDDGKAGNDAAVESYEKRYLKQLIERMQAKREEEKAQEDLRPSYQERYPRYQEDLSTELETALVSENVDFEPYQQKTDDVSPTKEELRPYLNIDFQSMRIVGQALKTFIILEQGSRLYFVDQHAAHERVLFERFYKEFKQGRIVSQMLLHPYEIPVPTGEEGNYAEAIDYFRSIGIEAEFIANKVVVKALPVFGSIISIEDMRHIIESYLEQGSNAYTKNFVEMVIMRSCKAAIKSGDELNEIQMRDLLNMLSACENPKTCPHGRPIVIELDRRFFDRLFKRIV